MPAPDAAGVAPDFAATVRHLKRRLGEPLPGPAVQARMAPGSRADSSQKMSVEGRDCQEAGVLALLFPQEEGEQAGSGSPVLLLTERRDHLDDHGGQVSFPGGQREPGETLADTALREAHEEVALAPADVRLLGALTPLYIPPSRFCVHPFVAVAKETPTLRPAEAEVARLLRVPLADLLGPDVLTREPWTLHGRTVEVPFFDVAGAPPIWGATSMMLAELLALF